MNLPDTCESIQPELKAYLDGEQTAVSAEIIAKHLESCAVCQAIYEDISSIKKELVAMTPPGEANALDPVLRARIIAAIPDLNEGTSSRKTLRSFNRGQILAWSLAAAAVFVAIVLPRVQNGSPSLRMQDMNRSEASAGSAASPSPSAPGSDSAKSEKEAMVVQPQMGGASGSLRYMPQKSGNMIAGSAPQGAAKPDAARPGNSALPVDGAQVSTDTGYSKESYYTATTANNSDSVDGMPAPLLSQHLYTTKDIQTGTRSIQKVAIGAGNVVTHVSMPRSEGGRVAEITLCGTPEKIKRFFSELRRGAVDVVEVKRAEKFSNTNGNLVADPVVTSSSANNQPSTAFTKAATPGPAKARSEPVVHNKAGEVVEFVNLRLTQKP